MSNLQIYSQNQGLGGWFGRMVRKLAGAVLKIAEGMPIVGMVVKAANEALNLSGMIENPDNWNWRSTDQEYEPTASEAAVLTTFTEKLKSFYRTLANDLSTGLQMAGTAEKILIVNSCLNRMSIVKAYFASNETAGLSSDAVKSRDEIILTVFQPLHDVINQYMEGEAATVVPVTLTITQEIANQFSGLISGSLQTAYSSQNYREISEGTPTLPGSVINLPAIPGPSKGDSGIVPTKQEPIEPETEGSGLVKKAAVVGFLALAAYLIFGGKETKKPSKTIPKTKTKKVTI